MPCRDAVPWLKGSKIPTASHGRQIHGITTKSRHPLHSKCRSHGMYHGITAEVTAATAEQLMLGKKVNKLLK